MKRRYFLLVVACLASLITGCANSGGESKVETAFGAFVDKNDLKEAVRLYDPDLAESGFLEEPFYGAHNIKIDQSLIQGDGGSVYIAAYTNDLLNRGALAVFELDGAIKAPRYFQVFGERIEGVRVVNQDYNSELFLEVTAYGASGSFSSQTVTILRLAESGITPVWDYQTISIGSHMVESEAHGPVLEINFLYASYLLVPCYQVSPDHGQRDYLIVVNETVKNVLLKEERVLAVNETTEKIEFVWDKEKGAFVRQQALTSFP
jgi:hypothetical protein